MSYVPPRSWLCNPLNTSKYLKLDKDERTFFKVTTQIEDDAELDRHILDVQAQAYKVCLPSSELYANRCSFCNFCDSGVVVFPFVHYKLCRGAQPCSCKQIFPYPCIRIFGFTRCVKSKSCNA